MAFFVLLSQVGSDTGNDRVYERDAWEGSDQRSAERTWGKVRAKQKKKKAEKKKLPQICGHFLFVSARRAPGCKRGLFLVLAGSLGICGVGLTAKQAADSA